MHKEGVVIKVTDQFIVLLCDDGTFKNVKRANGIVPLIGEKLDVRQKRNINSLGFFSTVAAVACVALFLFYASGRFSKVDVELAYVIAIDINPSIEVQVNKELYTIGLTALNKSGEKITNAIDYKGKPLNETIDLIISQSYIYGFLNQTSTGLVTSSIVPMSDKFKIDKDEVKAFINDSLIKNKIHAEVQIAIDKKETLESAHELGVTVNKYRVYKSLIDSGLPVTVEEVKENSIRNLLEMTEKHNLIQKNEAEVPQSNNQNLNNKDTKLEESVPKLEQKEEIHNENNKDKSSDNPAPNDNSTENKDKKNEVEDVKKLGEDIKEFEEPAELEVIDEYTNENKGLEKNEEELEADTDNGGRQENPSIDANEQNDNEKNEDRPSNDDNGNDEKADSKLIKPTI